MTEERRIILEMLRDGKIDEEQATRLLQAVGEKAENEKEITEGPSLTGLMKKLTSTVDRLVQQTADGIRQIDLEGIADYVQGAGSRKYNSRKEFIQQVPALHDEPISFNIKNERGPVKLVAWDEEVVECRVKLRYDETFVDESHELVHMKKENGVVIIATDTELPQGFVGEMIVNIPRHNVRSLLVQAPYGMIEMEDVIADTVKVSSTNGKINLKSIQGDQIDIKGINGRIEVFDVHGESLVMETVNGPMIMSGLFAETVSIQNVNGSVNVHDVTGVVKDIKVETVNGSIRISLVDYIKPVKVCVDQDRPLMSQLSLSDKFISTIHEEERMTAYTAHYREGESCLTIDAKVTNGVVRID